jgi:hypothetical protein
MIGNLPNTEFEICSGSEKLKFRASAHRQAAPICRRRPQDAAILQLFGT